MAKAASSVKRIPGGIAGAALRRQSGNAGGAGFTGPFFPPGKPLTPQAPTSVQGRRFDYSIGINLNNLPRQQQGQNAVSFALLRRFAEPSLGGLDIVRLLIEKRKAQMKAQTLSIVGRDDNDDGGTRARNIETLLRKPDGVNTWRGWLNMVLEDHFVIDAVALYPRVGGNRPLFEQMDGATISVMTDDAGRQPVPPLPAYQQYLDGQTANDYTSDMLAYYVGNPRVHKLYGMSPVEQMIGIIRIALNRQLSILEYFESGSVPDMLIGVPDTWNVDTITQFQEWFDSILSGQLGERRKARFIPGGANPFETKGLLMDPVIDEYLTRVACFCLGVSAQAFVKEMNRATSETAKQSAMEEGLEPTKLFVTDLVDDLLERIGAPDLKAQWEDEEIQDPQAKATVAVMLRGGATGNSKPVITLDEQRDMMGLPPATPDQVDELDPPPPEPIAPVDGTAPPIGGMKAPADGTPAKPGKTGSDSAAKRRGGRLLPPVPKNLKLRARVEKGIGAAAKSVLVAQRKAIVTHLRAHAEKLTKATLADLQELVNELERHPWDDEILGKIRALLIELATERSTAALDHLADEIGGTDDEFRALLHQANENAVEWARGRAANLVTEVSDTTRTLVNEMTSVAIDEGITNSALADQFEGSFGFSQDRATMIARTETANADSQGTLIGFRESGVVTGKQWFPDEEACPICLENADDGTIGLDDVFSSGDDAPAAHPNCECTLVPVVGGEED